MKVQTRQKVPRQKKQNSFGVMKIFVHSYKFKIMKQVLTAVPNVHTDVRGNVQHYVEIRNENGTKMFIVSGPRTLKNMELLQDEPKQTTLELQEIVNQENLNDPNPKQEVADAIKVDNIKSNGGRGNRGGTNA